MIVEGKVVSLADKKAKSRCSCDCHADKHEGCHDCEENHQPSPATVDLEAIAKKNRANDERVRKERANANKGVLRSYRLKQ